MYFSVSLLIFELLSAVPWENPVISIVYYIGIFACSLLSMAICFTRMRGGDPVALIAERSGIAFYPHARG